MRHKSAVTLQLLELFLAIEAAGSISAAARKLGLSPSFAARKLAVLEEALDVRLFQRTTRKVRLTEGGRLALEWARRVLGEYSGVVDRLEELKGRPAGLIRIALSDHAAAAFLPAFLKSFTQRYPKIRYSVLTTDRLLDPVEHGFDIAVHSGLIPNSSLVGVQIRAVHRILCAAPDYLARRGAPSTPSDLAMHDCLAHSPSEPSAWYFKKGSTLVGQTIVPLLAADSYIALLEFARRGLGIARISRNVARQDLRAGRLVQVLADYQCVHHNGDLPAVWILYADRRLPQRTRVFVEAFTAYMKKALSSPD